MKVLASIIAVVLLSHSASCNVNFGIAFQMDTYSTLEGGPFQVCLEGAFGTIDGDGNVTLERTYDVGKAESSQDTGTVAIYMQYQIIVVVG